MSEEKYEERVLKLLGTIAEQTKPKLELPKSGSSEPEHKHWDANDLLNSSCPECKTEVEKIGKTYMQKALKERKDLEFECVDCGTHVKKEEDSCPTCGGKQAKSRPR